jgi:hypothetical protein
MGVKRSLAVVIGLASAMVAADLAIAHHGWSGYDSEQVLNLTEAIQESGYDHPHRYVKLAAMARSGWSYLHHQRGWNVAGSRVRC